MRLSRRIGVYSALLTSSRASRSPVAVREPTGGAGVDQVIEIGGGTLEESIKSSAIEGLVNFIGRLDASRAQFIAMNRAIEANRLKPVIHRVLPFEDVPAAFRHYEANRPFGKVVIKQGRGEEAWTPSAYIVYAIYGPIRRRSTPNR